MSSLPLMSRHGFIAILIKLEQITLQCSMLNPIPFWLGTLKHKQALPAFGILAWVGHDPPVCKMGNRHLKWSLIIHNSRVTAIKNIRLLGSKALVPCISNSCEEWNGDTGQSKMRRNLEGEFRDLVYAPWEIARN